MTINYECPQCGSGDLDNGSFDYDGPRGIQTHTPEPLHFSCMDCGWDGSEANEVGDYEAMMEDKADARREDEKIAAWEETVAMLNHNDL